MNIKTNISATRLLCLWSLSLAGGCQTAEPPAARPPDVLLVVMDTVREDVAFGSTRSGLAQQLEALAAQGVRFTDVTAHGSWTWPSHASLFTGLPPWEHGAHFVPPSEADHLLGNREWAIGGFPSSVPTLAEQFTAAGYRTVSISENGLISTALGSTRGFEVSIERPSDSTNTLWSIDQASQVVQKDDERPLFLFVNLLDAHTPWYLSPLPWLDVHRPLLEPGASPDWLEPFVTHLPSGGVKVDLSAHHPPSNLTGEEAFNKGVWQPPPEAWTLFRDMYDASVYRSDYKLHKLMNTWIGHRSGTVAVTSDHGELLGEHDAVFHARSVWPELTQVPLVIVSPDRIPAGGVVDAPVQMTDLHDTLLHIAGISEGPRSLLPAASGSGPVPAGPIQAAAWPDAGFGKIVGGMFQHEWRLHREGDRAVVVGSDGSASLYNLADDPGMQTDLLAVDPDAHRAEAEPLIQAARSWTVKASEQLPAPSTDTMDALEALGYIDPGTPTAPPETP